MFLRVVVLILGLAVVIGPQAWADHHGTPNNPNIAVDERLSDSDAAMALKAAQTLIDACAPLREFWGDFQHAEAGMVDEWRSEGVGLAESHGWGRMATLTIIVKDKPSVDLIRWRLFGHTVEFLMGGGRIPGVHIQKDAAHHLCDIPFQPELADGYGQYVKRVEALGFIK